MNLYWLKSQFAYDAQVKRLVPGQNKDDWQYYAADVLECDKEPCPRCQYCNGWYKPKCEQASLIIRCNL